MINITVYSNTCIDIESKNHVILTREDMIKFLKELIDKIEYGGEQICLEKNDVTNGTEVSFTTIERWR